jgi:hypothetical protein
MLLTMYQIYSLNESRNILNFALINEIIKISFGQTFWKFVGFYRLFMEVCRHLQFDYLSFTYHIIQTFTQSTMKFHMQTEIV